jgi:hypothetical protein
VGGRSGGGGGGRRDGGNYDRGGGQRNGGGRASAVQGSERVWPLGSAPTCARGADIWMGAETPTASQKGGPSRGPLGLGRRVQGCVGLLC